jgi:Zn-dependent peptidase ImmA (M78 family)
MSRGVVASLRDIVPLRPLTYGQAMRIAELQAGKFLKLMEVEDAPVSEKLISELPRVQVERMRGLPASGASQWASQRWLVLLNASEPRERQRFSLAHEFKHIIDHRFADLMYAKFPDADRARMIEQLCDYFAACLLMPRPWVKRAYCSGVQSIPEIARLFDVSQPAMQVRLNAIGLIDPTPRCIGDWASNALSLNKSRKRVIYERSAEPRFALELTS